MSSEITAYRTRDEDGWEIVPATVNREWMSQTLDKAALRCLPLQIANTAGWFILSPATFRAQWTSRSNTLESLKITFASKKDEAFAGSIKTNFGSGIITFALPYLFRTSEGICLMARGPANMPRADVVPLEGIVETDWSPYPFTMNWKITRPKVDVAFKAGDPICMITPYPLALPEQVEKCRIRPLATDHELQSNYQRAAQQRVSTNTKGGDHEFELDYMRGYRPDGVQAREHRTNLKLEKFVEFKY